MLNFLILLVCVFATGILLYPPLARATLWRAAITPLASIIGSGFLVLGPILSVSFGGWAPLVMAGLCVLAYLFGGVIRFNIAYLDRAQGDGSPQPLETAASWALALAYVISVAYYLNLLGSFAAILIPQGGDVLAKIIMTGVFVVILTVGWTRGFSALERLEQVLVGLKVSIIAGLLFGLAWYFAEQSTAGTLIIRPAQVGIVEGVLLAFGLLVTVQGFETSRYLGAEYDAPTRMRSMRVAQGVSTFIYMIYIALLCYAFVPDADALLETAIIDMMGFRGPDLACFVDYCSAECAIQRSGCGYQRVGRVAGRADAGPPEYAGKLWCAGGVRAGADMGVQRVRDHRSRVAGFCHALCFAGFYRCAQRPTRSTG
tara:strand:- start:260 stop:1375 length:1116 start_codon:yes stop_codon:yes gene_type:complete